MKRFFTISLALFSGMVQAQVRGADYVYLSDVVMVNADNSVHCLQTFYEDLLEYKSKGGEQLRHHYDSYNCIRQPEPKTYNLVKPGTDGFYKPIADELWRLNNDAYAKAGEIVAYVRLEDYKTNLDQGFALIRDMQGLHAKTFALRKKMAIKIAANAKTLPATPVFRAYQGLITAIVHEEELIEKLSHNLNEAAYTGFSKDAILKSFLETDDLMPQLKPAKFALPYPASEFYKSCYEGIAMLQETKQHALDDYNYITSVDGRYANNVYGNLLNYFNNDLLSFFVKFYEQIQTQSPTLVHFPEFGTKSVIDINVQPWPINHLEYMAPELDTLRANKETTVLAVNTFSELSAINSYINHCVGNLSNLYNELRSEESTWRSLRHGDMPHKNPLIKFDHFKLPLSSYALIVKYSKNISPIYRASLLARVDDLQNIMIALHDRTAELSLYMSSGAFREKGMAPIEENLQTLDKLYNEFDLRKEKLYYEVRKIYKAYPPYKVNSWTTASNALLKAADHSRAALRAAEKKLYDNDPTPISTTALHDDQRDLIVNELKYMNGIARELKYSGTSPYIPYEYIPGYLKTLEEKMQALSGEVRDKKEAYWGILYMHNRIVDEHNRFAELGLGGDENAIGDPMKPMYILPHINQLMKYRYQPPEPEEKPREVPPPEPEVPVEVPVEEITFDGFPFNNLVLLLDVSSSMDKPDRLPLLKKDFQRLVKFMRPEDEVSIVVYSGKAAVLLPPTSARDTSTIVRSIGKLRSDGKTNIADGMNLAYKIARKNFKPDGNNRIILATDGEFNTGESLYTLAEKNSSDIPLTIFDFSQKAEPIKSIQSLAEKGKGNYVKVNADNSLEALANEARKGAN